MNIERTIERLRAEFLEMPGLRLTAEQVTRLCGVDAAICHGVLNTLIDVGFLRRNLR
jgi:DNA-binding IclR family transcriptional regulator